MEYIAEPNLLLEALAWLGRRAAGRTVEDLADRLAVRGIQSLQDFRTRLSPLVELSRQLHTPEQETLERLFGNLEGFPYNTIGSYSVGFLLFYPMLDQYNGDFNALMGRMSGLSPDQVAQNLMLTLGLKDKLGPDAEGCSSLLIDCVLQLGIPAESRLAILEAHRNYGQLLTELEKALRPVLEELEAHRPMIRKIADDFGAELKEIGYEEYMRQASGLIYNSSYCMCPMLLGPDTNLSLEPAADGSTKLYCGILRHVILQLLNEAENAESRVYEVMKLLGDQTRFDILCYLRDHSAYGQELSDKFNLARNTIHHHMSKLLNAGLVTCTENGNKVYYSIDREHLDWILRQMRKLLISDGNSE